VRKRRSRSAIDQLSKVDAFSSNPHDASTIIRIGNVQSGYWQERATTDFRLVDPEATVALLPVAAVEQHGPHLPLATDALINDAVVRAALQQPLPQCTLLVLPAQTVGFSPEHTSFGGTLTIADTTLADVWTDLGRSVARAGVRKLVIFNTHGGQKPLVDLVAMRLRSECRMLVARASYFAFGTPPGVFDAAEAAHDIHGGEVETSLMLHVAPELVRTAEIADFRGLPHELAARNRLLGAEKPVGIGWRSEDLTPSGACGNAARAHAQKGAKHLAHLAERLGVLVAELAATPLATLK
jgi:creatinine amidohydrolase